MGLNTKEITKLGILLLRIGTMMQSNGASTGRIRITIDRIIKAYGYHANMLITYRTMTITILNSSYEPVFNSIKRTVPMGVNFKIISGISRMSLLIDQQIWKLTEIEDELVRLSTLPHYPRLLVLVLVSAAGASFCFLSGGNYIAMGVTALATFVGLFVRQESTKMRFNPHICVFFAAFTATLIAGAFRKFFPELELVQAFATCVLFLIPGVPLINSVNDIVDGNILNGVIRAVVGFVISFMIALGMLCSILIYNF